MTSGHHHHRHHHHHGHHGHHDEHPEDQPTGDLYAKIMIGGNIVSSSNVVTLEDWSIIQDIKLKIWRKTSADPNRSSSVIVMDVVEFTLPCSGLDISAIQSICQGTKVMIAIRKTGNINGHSMAIEDFRFDGATFVGSLFFLKSNIAPSVTLGFKATKLQVIRYAYDQDGNPLGQTVTLVDLSLNTSQ